MGLLGRVFVLINYKSLHSIWPELFRVGTSDFFISKSKTIVKPIWLRNVALVVSSFLLKLFLSPQKNEWWLSDNTFLILSALCTIVWLWLDNQRIKACRQVWNLYALPSALVAGGSVLSLHGGEGLSDTGGRIFGCSDYSYALPMPLNLARTVCVPTALWGCADSAYKRADSADKCRQKCRVQTVVHINDKFVYTV